MNKLKQKKSARAPKKKPTLHFVTTTKWELPVREARSYWSHIFDEMEAEKRKVNESMYSIFPSSSSNIPLDTSASNSHNTPPEYLNLNDKTIISVKEPIFRISPPSPSAENDEFFKKTASSDAIELLKTSDSSNFSLDQLKDKEEDQKATEMIEKSIFHKPKLPVFSAISKITQLTKISRCVNDFLASTRIKVKASISPRNNVHPLRESVSVLSQEGNCIIEKKFIAIENQTTVEKSSIKTDAIEHVMDKWESILPQKHVLFDENTDSVERIIRPRAPSLGVASLVPSFGKIISSVEYPDSVDSRSSVESPEDMVIPQNLLIPREKRSMEKSRSLAAKAVPYRSRGVQKDQGHHWPRKTIIHTIRALKAMKAGTKAKERLQAQQDLNSFVSSPLPMSWSIAKSETSSIEEDVIQTPSTSSTIAMSQAKEMIPILPNPVHLVQKASSIQDLPPLGGIYQRRKANKCLACLHRWTPPTEPYFPISEEAEALHCKTASDFTDFLVSRLTKRTKKVKVKESICKSDEPSPSPLSNLEDFKTPIRESISLMEKISQGSLKDDIKSAKSISTLSLSSDHSRTLSDQEDSDHGPEAVDGEEVPGTGSKYRAPCHAPLNLKPSTEPLMALKGRKSKSIQSRVASLEKSVDEASEGGTDADDDDDADENVSKVEIPKTPQESAKIRASEYVKRECLKREKKTELEAPSLSEDIYHQLNVELRATEHNPSLSFRPLSPVMSESEIMEITARSLDEDKPVKDILQLLLREYLNRLSHKLSNKSLADRNVQRIERITKKLLALLVDAKLYLNPLFTASNLQFSSKQKPYCNSQQLRRYLPFKSYNLVAPILGMPEWYPKRWSAIKSARSLKFALKPKDVAGDDDSTSESEASKNENSEDFDVIVHPPSTKESLDGLSESKKCTKNPYATFLTKPRRKVVIWRPLVERDFEGYDPEATLKNRAARVTDRICKDFCDWMKSLGESQNATDETTLKDMFETDFSAEACRTLQVAIREMPMIPTVVAETRHCSDSGEPEVTRRQIIRDVNAERKPKTVVAFSTTVPDSLRYEPPNNDVYRRWIECSSVPQDLETMTFVWENITNLDSVRGFSDWLQSQSSEVMIPTALSNARKKSISKKL